MIFFGLFVGGCWTKVLSCRVYDALFTMPIWLKSGAHGFAFCDIFCGFILLFLDLFINLLLRNENACGAVFGWEICFWSSCFIKVKKIVLYFILYVCCVVLCCFQFGLFTFGFCFVLFFYCVNMLLGSSANLLINLIFFWGILASFVALKTSEQLISSEIF